VMVRVLESHIVIPFFTKCIPLGVGC
jgi:hypothetical protein